MEPGEYVAALAAASEMTAEAATAAGPDAAVPSAPGWTVADLLVHMTSGDLWARTIVETRSTQRVANELPDDPPTGEALVPWYLDGAHRLVAALGEIDPATSLWTFSKADRTARFWLRRRAIETTVHCYDAQLAAGHTRPVDAPLAVAGIDEFLEVFLPRFGAEPLADGATIHLHCTDVDGEWLVTGGPDVALVTREHAKGDVAARGTASDLLLFLWGRAPIETLELFGDAALLERFRAASHV
jgi:uncharacterized protein (TIGR03083 family)